MAAPIQVSSALYRANAITRLALMCWAACSEVIGQAAKWVGELYERRWRRAVAMGTRGGPVASP
jgi:hypothetical protein